MGITTIQALVTGICLIVWAMSIAYVAKRDSDVITCILSGSRMAIGVVASMAIITTLILIILEGIA